MIEKYNPQLIPLKPLYNDKTFYQFDIKKRWEIRISDGIWITPEKLVKTTMTKEELKNNPDAQTEAEAWLETLVASKQARKSTNGASYALTTRAVEAWHAKNNLELEQKLINKNLPARIYGGYTETDGFQLAPLRAVANLTLKENSGIKKPLQEALAGIGMVTTGRDGRIVVRAAAPEPAFNIMKKVAEEYGSTEPVRVAYPVFRRERTDVPEGFYSGLIRTYGVFVQGLLPASQRETVKVLLGKDPDEQAAFYVTLAAEGFSKFDESGGVPYGAYLASATPNWINDLPTHTLGEPLATFQRNRKRAIKELHQETGNPTSHRYTDQELADKMGLPLKEYVSFKDSNENWVKMRTSEELTWKDNNQERISHHLDPARDNTRDTEEATDLLLAILDTGIQLRNTETTEQCLEALVEATGTTTASLLALRDIPETYKAALYKNLRKRRQQTINNKQR